MGNNTPQLPTPAEAEADFAASSEVISSGLGQSAFALIHLARRLGAIANSVLVNELEAAGVQRPVPAVLALVSAVSAERMLGALTLEAMIAQCAALGPKFLKELVAQQAELVPDQET